MVVPIRLAQHTARATLSSLLEQCRDYPAEVIAVVSSDDPTLDSVRDLNHPRLRVIVKQGRAGVPQLRRDAVLASQAPFVMIAEDHCLYPSGWIRGLVEVVEKRGVAVSGGPVENGRTSYTGWAQYFTRYSGFMPPVTDGPIRGLPGNNACYRRELLISHRELLTAGFWEAEFNHAVLPETGPFWMSPSLAISAHQVRGTLEYASLRYRHGRCYGARRVASVSSGERRWLLLQASLIPATLFARAARAIFRKRRRRKEFFLTTPLLLIYFGAWGLGELVGYLFGSGSSCLETD